MVTYFSYDALGREIQRILNYQASLRPAAVRLVGALARHKAARIPMIATSPSRPPTTLTARCRRLLRSNAHTGDQVTQYSYGTTLSDSDLASSLLKRFEILPDSTGGSDQIAFAYNRQAEVKQMTDQNGTVHAYNFDLLGRQTHDRITTVGTDIDNAVLRISTSYEVRGMPQNITSYDNATVGSGSVVNDVQRGYNAFGQLVIEYQSHSGVVNTMTTPSCQYEYADGSANTIGACIRMGVCELMQGGGRTFLDRQSDRQRRCHAPGRLHLPGARHHRADLLAAAWLAKHAHQPDRHERSSDRRHLLGAGLVRQGEGLDLDLGRRFFVVEQQQFKLFVWFREYRGTHPARLRPCQQQVVASGVG